MTVRPALSLALTALCAGSLSAQSPIYRPGDQRFHATTRSDVSQTVAGATNTFSFTMDQDLRVALRSAAKDTLTARITIDSIAFVSAAGGPDVSALKGSVFTTKLSPAGVFYSVTAPAGLDPQLAALSDGIGRFLPRLPKTLKPGASWVDTVNSVSLQNGVSMNRTQIMSYSVAGDTVINGRKAVRVARTGSAKASGAGMMMGASVTVTSEGTSSGTLFVSSAAEYLGESTIEKSNGKVVVPAQNAEVTTSQTSSTTIRALP